LNVIALCSTNWFLNYTYCVKDKCNYEVLGIIDKYLGNSEWFQRSDGADHIIVASHYAFNAIWEEDTDDNRISIDFATRVAKDFPNIFKLNKVAFENVSHRNIVNQNRVNLPSMYVGKSCGLTNDIRYRFVLIANLERSIERQNIRDWIEIQTQKEHEGSLRNLIGGDHIDFCSNIGHGKYGFHVKGDSFGSSRLIDLLLNGVVPIFTDQKQYSILPHWIPFKQLSYFADVKSEMSFMNSIRKIIANEDDECKIKHDAILQFQELFDHETGVPFDMYMYHFAKKIEENKFARKTLALPSWKNLISHNKYEHKIYEYEAPNGMRPEDLMECFRKRYSNQNPTIDTLNFPGIPYLPEDLAEWFLHNQTQASKYRTTKEEADFLVVNTMPVLSAYVDECNGMTHNERQQMWTKIIHKSKFYREKPQDHLFICQSWTCYTAVSQEMLSLAYEMTYLIHEPNICWISGKCDNPLIPKHVIVIPYVSHSHLYDFPRSWVDREYKVSFLGSLDRLTKMRSVLKNISVQNLPFLHVIDEGVMDIGNVTTMTIFNKYVNDMHNSQFCLVLQGDTPSSRRLFDAMVTGCIPVFTGTKYSMPFENLIPYDRFSIRIDEDEWLNHPEQQLYNIKNIDMKKGLQMHNEIRKYAKYIDWRSDGGVLEGILSNMNLIQNNLDHPLNWVNFGI